MARSLRQTIISKLQDVLPANKANVQFELKSTAGIPELHINHAQFRPHMDDSIWQNAIIGDMKAANPRITPRGVSFPLNKDALFEEAFTESSYAPLANAKSQTILVEFSSPNIAKPFHVGHLRSTIIGNFVANILRRSPHQHRVHRINYLGDWGTQFGFLAVGMRLAELSDEQIRANPIQQLFQAYVRAHDAAKRDPDVADTARELFCRLEETSSVDRAENGAAHDDPPELVQWQRFRGYTVDELRNTYTRLGVQFDEYCWESDYRKPRIQAVLQQMRDAGVLRADDEYGAVAQVGDRRVPMIKSDGTTMYLTRDCAALQDRARRHGFDRMLYVVDNAQFDHFRNLFAIGRQMEVAGVEGAEHVKFGRIQGMSTREGKVVFLRDILDEARDRMYGRQQQTHTTRVDIEAESTSKTTADILGISAVIVNDLKQRRQRDYVFDWDKTLQMSGDTGIRLQYTHCRLCSLADTFAAQMPDEHDERRRPRVSMLREPQAEQLLLEIARFEDVLARSEESLEACVLVVYLFGLCNAINRALTHLNVRDHPSDEVRVQRLLLFARAREVLHDGMVIIGVKPLRQM